MGGLDVLLTLSPMCRSCINKVPFGVITTESPVKQLPELGEAASTHHLEEIVGIGLVALSKPPVLEKHLKHTCG